MVSVLGQMDWFNFKNTPKSAHGFERLIARKLEFISATVGNATKLGIQREHILYASTIIDHSLNALNVKGLILTVLKNAIRTKHIPMRQEDFIYKISA